MASTLNAKTIHRDGKAELKLGLDNNSKILEGEGTEFIIKNADGTNAKIAKENIVGMPDNVSEKNKLVTQNDLNKMANEIHKALAAQAESMQSIIHLAKIVGGLNGEK